MQYAFVFAMMVFFTACNNASKTEEPVVNDSAVDKVQAVSPAKFIHKFNDTALENKITAALLKLPFVIKSDKYIDSFSDHKHRIAFMLDEPELNGTGISIQAGYNGGERFETYYRFLVSPATMEIKIYDPVEDKTLTLKECLKSQP